MLLPEQLELVFDKTDPLTSILSLRERRTTPSDGEGGTRSPQRVVKTSAAPPLYLASVRAGLAFSEQPIHLALKECAQQLLRLHGAGGIADQVCVEWNWRLKSCAGRADYRHKLITLNPRLRDHPHEIERTFLHELAHLLAQFRAGRRRIRPHGQEWRVACADLGIAGEQRCHNLPFPIASRIRRFLYKCPHCARDFPRVRRIRRAIACLACCLAHNGGKFDARFRLRLVKP